MKKDVIFGKKPVLEAITGKRRIEKIMITKGNSFAQEIYQAVRGLNITVQTVPEEKLNRVTRKNHQGVVAYLGYVDYQQVENVLAKVYEQGQTPLFVALDGVTDVGNFGAIARSAYALGAHAIIVPEKGSALINGVAVKASAGAIEKLNICKVPVLKQSLVDLQQNGIALFASNLSANAKQFTEVDYKVPCCIIMGNEEKGVGKNIVELAEEQIQIPMARKFDSLNVSVATGIILAEAAKQRMAD